MRLRPKATTSSWANTVPHSPAVSVSPSLSTHILILDEGTSALNYESFIEDEKRGLIYSSKIHLDHDHLNING